ncbi:hypothetical protein [uncultured Reyranella sp.]|uniref:hypothetical protein n=1 Tax=uncultured Reyranella sp. TaxID=735512 RepID=UPI0025DC5982|nr:hypothetical protein [uncultured Reyranella sp.]
MAHEKLIAELRKEVEMYKDSLAFWEQQPESQVPGFSVALQRQKLKDDIAENEKAIAILEGE